MREAWAKVDADKAYEPLEALKILKETATAKFVETAEAHIRLGIDPKYTDQQLRTTGLSALSGSSPRALVGRPRSA